MVFAKQLRRRIKRGEITTSIRIWRWPHLKEGCQYKLDRGQIVVTSVKEIGIEDIMEAMALESGFENVAGLLKTARHGRGSEVYFIEFYHVKGSRDFR